MKLPCRIWACLLLSSAGPAVAADDHELAARVDAFVTAQMPEIGLPGMALAIVRGDQVVLLKGYGSAGNGRSVTPQTTFNLASVSKSFTALAVMQLVEAGKIDLDQPCQRYLPWFRLADEKQAARITVRQLLTQTSGLSTLSGRSLFLSRDVAPGALERGVRTLANEQLVTPPGAVFHYSNANYSTAAAVVAAVAQQPFDSYIREHVFEPLGMRNSFASKDAAAAADLAIGHRYWYGYPIAAANLPYSHSELGSGELFASAEDLARYLTLMLNGGMLDGRRVLQSETIAELQAPAARLGPDLHYAFGWFVREPDGGSRTVFHDGDQAHYHASILMIPDLRLGVAILMNANSLASNQLHEVSRNILNVAQDRATEHVRDDPIAVAITYLPLLILVCQAAFAFRALRRIRRWRAGDAVQAGSGRPVLRALLSITGNLGVALSFLLLLPWLFEVPFSALFIFAPDFAWPAAISSGVALCWIVVSIVLFLRQFSSPASAH